VDQDWFLHFADATLEDPEPSSGYYLFSKIFGEMEKAVWLRRLHEPKLRRCSNKAKKVTTIKRAYETRGPSPKRT